MDISKKIGARTAKPSKNLRNQRLLGSQKLKLGANFGTTNPPGIWLVQTFEDQILVEYWVFKKRCCDAWKRVRALPPPRNYFVMCPTIL